MNCPSCGGRVTTSSGQCPACGAAGKPGYALPFGDADGVTGAGLPAPGARAQNGPDLPTGFGAQVDTDVTGFGASGDTPPPAAPGTHGDTNLPTGFGSSSDKDLPKGFGARVGTSYRPGGVAQEAAETGAGIAIDSDVTQADPRLTPPPEGSDRQAGPLPPGPFGPRYHIVKLLGIGGMGAVYQAWDQELGVIVAMKVIRPEVAADPAAASLLERRFKQELLLARQVTHKNVVRIHELGEINGIKFITMPFIEGEELGSILDRRQKLPIEQILKVARGVATGLEAAHAAGVVHRDLKPANIMIDATGEPLIMDFGIARSTGGTNPGLGPGRGPMQQLNALTSGQTVVGAVVGTVEYMAPEQARAQPVDQRADIYAFGLILYDMLLNRRRTGGAGTVVAELTSRMQAAPPPPRSIDNTIPEPLERIVMRCLEPDAEKRFQTTPELVDALERLDEKGQLLPIARRITPRLIAGVIGAFLGLMILTWWMARTPPPEADRPPLSVLVADFNNATGEPVFDGLMEQALSVGIEGARFISAYQRSSALSVARELKAGSRLDEPTARLVALREGIKVVLSGTIEAKGSGYAMSVRAIDTTSGKDLTTAQAEARDRAGVLAAGGVLAGRLRAALGDTRAADPKETFSSSSLEAVAAYVRAQQLSSAGKDADALNYFKEATERDPQFGRAYGGWAMSATRLGRRDEAEELWKRALALKDRMTERERYRMEGIYFQLVSRNYDKAIDTYSALVRDYPADGAAHNNLAVGYFRRLEFARALAEARKVLAIYPNSPLYRTNLALFAMYAGDFQSAAREAERLVSEKQASYDTYLPLAISAIATGRLDAAASAYTNMAAVDSSGASLAPLGLADLALARGMPEEAVKLLRAGIADDRKQDNLAGVAYKQTALADALGMQGNKAAAMAASKAALAIDETEAAIIPAVRWLIAAGKLEEAAKLGTKLDNQLEPQTRAYGRIVAAQIALAGGRYSTAVDALREAQKFADLWLVRFYLGVAYLEAKYYAEALSEFELCEKRRGEGFAAFLDDIPTARYATALPYWMGRAHEGLGLKDKARSDYETFLKPRAEGSPDPLARDARARLAAR